jgi:flavin reductase (DIM6/NTAB) family NADH-FMN oxidoreductase RutF
MKDNILNKQEFNGNLLSPLPVVLVGALVNEKPNYLVIGYICPFDFGKYIFFSLFKKRYTSLGIHQQKSFSVNIPNENQLKELEICGSKSGSDFDKSSLFESFYGELGSAPMIKHCPVSIECQVNEFIDYGNNEGIIGKVINSYVNKEYIEDNKLDWRKIHPILWATGGDFNYYRLGDRILESSTK